MMTLEQLPPKGVKREQAIFELGKDEANGELLLQLVNTEKGKCKTAAQKALAQLEYDPAAPLLSLIHISAGISGVPHDRAEYGGRQAVLPPGADEHGRDRDGGESAESKAVF